MTGERDVLAEALAAACDPRATPSWAPVLARIGGVLGRDAGAAFTELAALDVVASRVRRATWAARARAPIPAALRGIDPSWIEHALASAPPRARAILAATADDPTSLWQVRWACAGLPPMPAIVPDRARPATPTEILTLAPAALRGWLENVGADQLAYALGAHAIEIVGLVGDRLRDAIQRVGRGPRAGGLGSRRAAIGRAQVSLDDEALLRIGARTVAPHVDPIARYRVARRLPRRLGLVVAAELAAFAGQPADAGPAWSVLVAPD